jgi:YHS domain-containing protein
MRFLFFRILVPLLVLWLVRGILRSLFNSGNAPVVSRRPQPAPKVSPGGELKKDPVCGTYVSSEIAVIKRVNGEIVHFCSPACRDKYRVA